MRWLQFTIPYPMAKLLRDCVALTRRTGELSGVDDKSLADLQDFLEYADLNPKAFTPSGTMARSLKLRARRVDGIRRNDGSLADGQQRPTVTAEGRTARRKAAHKLRRQNRAKTVADHNRDFRAAEHDPVAGHRFVSLPERKRNKSRFGFGRAKGQDQGAKL